MKISELNLAGAIAGTEVFPIVQGGETKKVSIADALAGAGGVPTLQQVTDVGGNTTHSISIYNDSTHYINFNVFDPGSLQSNIDLTNSTTSYGFANALIASTFDELGDYKDIYLQLQTNNINTGLARYISLGTNSTGNNIHSNLTFTNSISNEIFELTNRDGFNRLLNYIPYGSNLQKGAILEFQPEVIKTLYYTDQFVNAALSGFELDFAGERYSFGDIGNSNASVLVCTPFNAKFNRGLNMQLDDINIKLGDYNTSGNQTVLEVDDFNRVIKTTSRGNEIGFRFDFANEGYFFGDYGVTSHGLSLDNANGISNLFSPTIRLSTGNASGFFANGNTSNIGDTDENGNLTYFGVDDANTTLNASSNLIGSGGIGSADRIKIKIGGTDYLIVLETP